MRALLYFWTDARRPVPRLWIRCAEVRGGGGGGGGGTSLGEWEHNTTIMHYYTLTSQVRARFLSVLSALRDCVPLNAHTFSLKTSLFLSFNNALLYLILHSKLVVKLTGNMKQEI